MVTDFTRWKNDEDGATLVFVGVCLTVLLGFAAVTFDLGRQAATRTDMQSFVDHVALAAAGELDGRPGARSRARAAANQLIGSRDVAGVVVEDRATFADEAQRILQTDGDFDLYFLDNVPDEDITVIDPSDFEAIDDSDARIAMVVANETNVSRPFYRAFSALLGTTGTDASVGAYAIAGSTEYACDVPTLMFCMPQDGEPEPFKGQTIKLRTGQDQGAAWVPGNFGFINPTDVLVDETGVCVDKKGKPLTGVDLKTCIIAASGKRTLCKPNNDGVELEPGQNTGTLAAVFNTRFDIFNENMNSKKSDPNYAPGPHTVSGLKPTGGGQCIGNNAEISTDTMAFPPDDCFASNICPYGGGRFSGGTGEWSDTGRTLYVNTNYGDPAGTSTNDPHLSAKTRFEYYKEEVAKAQENNQAILPDRPDDNGSVQCSPPANMVDDINRRVFIVAGLDCSGGDITGRERVKPVKYYEVFLLRPVGTGKGNEEKFDLYVEVIGAVGGDTAGNSDEAALFRTVVDLLR